MHVPSCNMQKEDFEKRWGREVECAWDTGQISDTKGTRKQATLATFYPFGHLSKTCIPLKSNRDAGYSVPIMFYFYCLKCPRKGSNLGPLIKSQLLNN